jgi:uncharacterized protein (TIGR02145 family)
MKRTPLFYCYLSLFLMVMLNSCKKQEVPSITTAEITNITGTSATGGGTITDEGSGTVVEKGICWSKGNTPTIADSRTIVGGGAGTFASDMTNLDAATTYYVRAYATNKAGTGYGIAMSFSTLGQAPAATTQAATNISTTSATLNGTVNANYLSTTVTFEYGTTTSYGQTITSVQSPVTGNNIINVGADISGLISGTTYHYRVKSANSIGTTNGNDLIFTTLPDVPTVTTAPVIVVIHNYATSGGNVSYDGGSLVTARGVCWGTSTYPSITGEHTIDGNGTGSFISKIRCLSYATTYYIRAYATNNIGIAYGNQSSFTTEISQIVFNPNLTYGSVSDIDGNCYKTIQIGNQTWMAENLKTSKYNDGSPIPNVTDNTEWENLLNNKYVEPFITTGAYCWYNNDSATYENVYGRLYNFGVVNTGKICPVGWHVPDGIDGLDGYPMSEDCYNASYLGGKLMEPGSSHWINPNTVCINNETGFTAVPAGRRDPDGTFTDLGYKAYFWTPEWAGHGPLVIYQMIPHSPFYCQSPTACGVWPTEGYSIRCVKDN